jgi:hypothetical protein
MSTCQITITDVDGNQIASAEIEDGDDVYVNTETVEELIPSLTTICRYKVTVTTPDGGRTYGWEVNGHIVVLR